jgi:hypothetical protein
MACLIGVLYQILLSYSAARYGPCCPFCPYVEHGILRILLVLEFSYSYLIIIIIIIIIIIWNQWIQTDRDVLANRPDIIIKSKKDKTSLLIDVAIL